MCDRSFKLFAQHRGLLKLLPREARPAITGLLELDPRKRWTLDQLLQDEWVQQIDTCTEQAPGDNHVHHVSTAPPQDHRNNLVIMTSEAPGAVAEKERKRLAQFPPYSPQNKNLAA
jgi:serine/threonine protein kinase